MTGHTGSAGWELAPRAARSGAANLGVDQGDATGTASGSCCRSSASWVALVAAVHAGPARVVPSVSAAAVGAAPTGVTAYALCSASKSIGSAASAVRAGGTAVG